MRHCIIAFSVRSTGGDTSAVAVAGFKALIFCDDAVKSQPWFSSIALIAFAEWWPAFCQFNWLTKNAGNFRIMMNFNIKFDVTKTLKFGQVEFDQLNLNTLPLEQFFKWQMTKKHEVFPKQPPLLSPEALNTILQ